MPLQRSFVREVASDCPHSSDLYRPRCFRRVTAAFESLTLHRWTPFLATSFLAFALVASACGHGRLAPAESAQIVREMPNAAVTNRDGVRLVATFDDLRGLQRELPDNVVAVKIRVVNHGAQNLQLLYEDFRLIGKRGHVYHALPVIPLDHRDLVARVAPVRPIYATENFQVAALYQDVYPSLPPSPAPMTRDKTLYDTAYGKWGGGPPPAELRRMAMPEGTLEPAGEITGYLYFESPIGSESHLSLRATLGGRASQPNTLTIPLRVD